MNWNDWWVWAVAAFVLALIEVFAPTQILLGFVGGAVGVTLLLAFGGTVGGAMTNSLPLTLLIFAVLSAVTWVFARGLLGERKGQVKTIDRDINED